MTTRFVLMLGWSSFLAYSFCIGFCNGSITYNNYYVKQNGTVMFMIFEKIPIVECQKFSENKTVSNHKIIPLSTSGKNVYVPRLKVNDTMVCFMCGYIDDYPIETNCSEITSTPWNNVTATFYYLEYD